LALGQDILAYANYGGFLYVVDLRETDNAYQVRLPSSNIVAMAVDGRLVAVLLRNDAASSTMVIHDHAWRQTSSFSFAHQSDDHAIDQTIHPGTILLNATGRFVDVFGSSVRLTQASNTHDMLILRIGHTRFRLSGEVLCQSVIELDDIHTSAPDITPGTANTEYTRTLGAVLSIGRPGLFCIPFATRHVQPGHDDKWSLIFDAVTTKFHHPESSNDDAMCGFDEKDSHQIIWKGCGYQGSPHRWLDTVRLASTAVDYGHSVGSVKLVDHANGEGSGRSSDPQVSALAMNDSFIVRFTPSTRSILIMSFDENVAMAGRKPTGLWAGPADDPESAIVVDLIPRPRGSRMRTLHRNVDSEDSSTGMRSRARRFGEVCHSILAGSLGVIRGLMTITTAISWVVIANLRSLMGSLGLYTC